MRGTTWPNGAYRQHSTYGDDAPNALETISGVLHVRETIFGHKWVYKLDETRKDVEKKVVKDCKGGIFFGVVICGMVIGLLIAAVTFTIIGSKYLDNPTNITANQWLYGFSSKMQNKMKLIYTLHNTNNSRKNETKDLTVIISEQIQRKINVSCLKCLESEICLQNTSAAYPECIPIKDSEDPTGCGGLCKLEVQYCKKLVSELNIFSCINIPTIICSENQWKCNETLLCISKNQKCDGTIHCQDKSDEYNCECDLKNNFRCGENISCISNLKKCDGSVDCWDNSDEIDCINDCGSFNFPCFNGECISKEKFCDGIIDCTDNSDEPKGCINTNIT